MRPPYRQENGSWLIELRLADPAHLFNTIDPSPFAEKDLDEAAERFIDGAVDDFHHHQPLRLVIQLPAERCSDTVRERSIAAIRHYFSWRAEETDRTRQRRLREGRMALLVGIAFVLLCMAVRPLISGSDSVFLSSLAEGLLIFGWVAMWRPVDTFLYGWWPLRRQARHYRRIADLPISVVPFPAPA